MVEIAQIQAVIPGAYDPAEQGVHVGDAKTGAPAVVTNFNQLLTVPSTAILRVQYSSAAFDTINFQNFVAAGGVGTMTGVTRNLSAGVANGGAATDATARQFGSFPGFITRYQQAFIAGNMGVGKVATWGLFSGAPVAPSSIASLANGYGFQIVDGVLKAIVVSGGVIAFSSAELQLTYNPLTWHVYEVRFSGAFDAQFLVDGHLVFKASAAGTLSLLIASVQLFITAEVHNTLAQVLANKLDTPSLLVSILGNPQSFHDTFHFVANGTYVVKRGPGKLHSVVVDVPSGGGNTVTIYDNVIAAGKILKVIPRGATESNIGLDLPFFIGLTIDSVGGIPPEATVGYV